MNHDPPDLGAVEFAEIDGLRVRYARSGVSQGVPVLLTSPWPESIYAFRDVLAEIDKVAPGKQTARLLQTFQHPNCRIDALGDAQAD